MSKTSGNPANGSVGDPTRNAIFRSPAAASSYIGVHGQIGFLLCVGNMRGILFDGKTCGGVAHWPLFAPGTDFTNLYGIVDGCVELDALTANCEVTVVENPALCASARIGANLTTGPSSLSWDGTLFSSAGTIVTVGAGSIVATDSAGVNHVLMSDGTPATGVASGPVGTVVYTGTLTIQADGETAECDVSNKPVSAATTVTA